jgi:3-oxoacyl-[acyl-carrier-protein] synthase III
LYTYEPVISGLGLGLPVHSEPSAAIDARLGKPVGWLSGACGVDQRPVASAVETQENMAAAACRRALADAGVNLDAVDLLLFAAAVGRQPIPATGPLIKRELGALDLPFPAYDVNATCLSALVALDLAGLHVRAGRARHVLVVSSEIASRALPWADDPATAGLFGDGAAAMLVSADTPQTSRGLRLGVSQMETYAEGYDACTLAAGGTRFDFHADPEAFAANAYFRMDGRALYRLSASRVPGFIDRLLARAGLQHDDIALVVPHQASPLALAHLVSRCGFAETRVFDRVKTLGNQVAASLPIALSLAKSEGLLHPGDHVLMIGTSAGLSLGGALLEVMA